MQSIGAGYIVIYGEVYIRIRVHVRISENPEPRVSCYESHRGNVCFTSHAHAIRARRTRKLDRLLSQLHKQTFSMSICI